MIIPEELLEQYSPIIKSWKIERNEGNSRGDVLKLSISLIDGSKERELNKILISKGSFSELLRW